MNKTGLKIALACAVFFGAVFALFPGLDLYFAGLFFDPATKSFPLKFRNDAEFVRQAAMWLAWAFAAPAIVLLVMKLILPRRKLLISARAALFLVITITLSAGIFSNALFKGHWGRPRPSMVTQFAGAHQFKPWWNPSGTCTKNCSFYSGEAATAFWTYAPAALAPIELRPLAYAAATFFGLATGAWRMAFGGHFFTDIAFAGIATFLIVWLVHGFIYRWPATRLNDERLDALITRLALPGHDWLLALYGKLRGRVRPPPRPDIPA